MSYNLILLKLLSNKEAYNKYAFLIPKQIFSFEENIILDAYKEYFDRKPDVAELNYKDFYTWLMLTYCSDAVLGHSTILREIFKRLNKIDLNEYDEESIVNELLKLEIKYKIEQELGKANFDLKKIQALVETLPCTEELLEVNEQSFAELLQTTDRSAGVTFSVGCLNKAFGGLLPGDFLIFAAYVDVGKTKFVLSQTAHIAPQLGDRPILWFNNEEKDNEVLIHFRKAVLQCTKEQLESIDPEKVDKAYNKRLGCENQFKLVNSRDMSLETVETYFQQYNPGLVVFDILDTLNFGGKKGMGEMDHIFYKKLYKKIRTLVQKYNTICFAISHCNSSVINKDRDTGEIYYQKWIGMNQLDGSLVGKASQADGIVTIGKDQSLQNRYLFVPKTKMSSNNIKEIVLLDTDRCIAKDYV